jgi:tetratricopeptide (TPR) repeat protein
MNKRYTYILLLLLPVTVTLAQTNYIDSIKHELRIANSDTSKLFELNQLADAYAETKPDTSLYYAEQAEKLSRKMGFKLNEVDALIFKAYALLNMGIYPAALQTSLSALAIAEDPKSEQNIMPGKYLDLKGINNPSITPHIIRLHMLARVHNYTGIVYDNENNYQKELYHYMQAKQLTEQIHDDYELFSVLMTLGRVYLSLKKPDSALLYEQKAYDLSMKIDYRKYLGSVLLNLARSNNKMYVYRLFIASV